MKHVDLRPYADPEAAARKLLELAASIEPVQDGRVHIEKINAPFLFRLKGTGSEFGAGLAYAVDNAWLMLHESGTYVKVLTPGEDLPRNRRAQHEGLNGLLPPRGIGITGTNQP